MITAEHFKDIRLGKIVAVDGFILIPVLNINPKDDYERMVSYETITSNNDHRNLHIFSCTMASFEDNTICFFQLKHGSPKDYIEVIDFILRSTIGSWCLNRNGTFIFENETDANIVISYLLS